MSDGSYQPRKMASVDTPAFDDVIAGFGRKTARTLFTELDPELPREQAKRYEQELVDAAELWKRLSMLDAAVRAACAVVQVEGKSCAEHMNRALGQMDAHGGPAQMAYVLTRRLLNDADLILDEATPFDPVGVLGLTHMTRAFVGLCRLRTPWAWQSLDEERARKLVKYSELTHESWRGRIARLAKEYEKEQYPNKVSTATYST